MSAFGPKADITSASQNYDPKRTSRIGSARLTHFLAFCKSLRRHDAQNSSGSIVGKQVKRAIGTLPYVANAFAQVLQQPLFYHDFVALELEPNQHFGFQRTIEQAALPARKQVAGIERHTGRRDGRRPVPQRVLDAHLTGVPS